ncbi:MAG: ATP-binding protein [bacterium]
MLIPRIYQNLGEYLKNEKVLIIYGPRRVGKSTLLKQYLSSYNLKYRLVSGDDIQVQNVLSSQDTEKISSYVQGLSLFAIDEAQMVPNIGLGLKMLVDNNPNISVIATGSSSFDLQNKVGEPLTGRKRTLCLYPISQLELKTLYSPFELKQQLEKRLIFGSYPEVLTALSDNDRQLVLTEIVNSYLLKDILELENVKGSKVLVDLLRLVAFQVGSEVSISELADSLDLDKNTVARYLNLFEKSFVLYNLRGFSRNMRKEVTKKSKYFFYDNGIRNALIANFNSLEIRDDVGKLWENFLVIERLKKQAYSSMLSNNYFWRTWDQSEVDFVEEREGKVFAYEFKYSSKKTASLPIDFKDNYPNSEFKVINPENYLEFVG